MKMSVMVMAFLCLAITQNCIAQQIKRLKVGDSFPAMTFNKVINAPYSSIPYSKLKDKVVVLDFFATWCSSCISLLPHMDSLKRKYGDRLEIFIVSREPRSKVENFLIRKPISKGIKLPFIVEDSVLCKYFPNKYLPHEVIVSNAKVVAVTYSEFVTEANLKRILRGDKVKFPLKWDWVKYDYDQSLIKNLKDNSVSIGLGEFFLSRSINGVPEMAYTRKNYSKTYERFTKINHTLLKLFERAAGFWEVNNRIVLNVRDSSKFITNDPTAYAWSRENRYCLEYQVPADWDKYKLSHWLLKQLQNFTHYALSVEKCLVDCWVLTKEKDLFEEPKSNFNFKNPISFKTIEGMVQSMNNQPFGNSLAPIVINETKDTSKVNIEINREDIYRPKVLANILIHYGYSLKPARRYLNMLIIKDKK